MGAISCKLGAIFSKPGLKSQESREFKFGIYAQETFDEMPAPNIVMHHAPDEAARARYQKRVFNIIDNVLEWSPRLALFGMMEKQQNVVNATESNSSNLQDSDPPRDFLSLSLDFPPTQEDPPQLNIEQYNQRVNGDEDNKDDIEQLIELLGLSELGLEEDDEKEERDKKVVIETSGSCYCDDGFYSKSIGVKGPKCEKEMERLDEWIKYLLKGDDEDDRSESLSLVHLLIDRVACAWQDGDGLGWLEFPSTIEEFLQNDPPK
ncbi:hypothetical protein NE237_011835 [Protea cynaroides]|uniref:Uncharacterized protein n=1 Tax=Protea cynaroides TaxID=273540 RepID=A0A9Q0JXG2_9MAGN|nr:hypothetical protein NE237_011835 [Protea cynaroides]